jgi:hypothetical protein
MDAGGLIAIRPDNAQYLAQQSDSSQLALAS